MNIKYYGVKGGAIDGYFAEPDYYISEILKNEEKLLVDGKFRDPQGDIDWITVTPYEKGVVYDLGRKPYNPGSTRYDNETSAKLIVTPEEASFIITGTDTLAVAKDENIHKEVIEQEKANKEKVKELIDTLGNKIEIDKIQDEKRSDNKFIRIVETRQEKKQREQYVPLMKASLKNLEQMQEQKKQMLSSLTPYQKIAKDALMNWNGLSNEEANNKIMTESVEQLEGQVYAMGSVGYAVSGISQNLGLTEEERKEFYNAVINGPADAPIFASVSAKTGQVEDSNQLELSVLSTIHDGWVVDNSSDKTYQKKVDRGQLRQYAPLELIGWNEAKSDLLFLRPVLESINVPLNEEQLEKAYHDRVGTYAMEMKISDPESLNSLVAEGKNYYPVLPEQLSEKLVVNSQVVTQQIIENWNNKDPKSLQAINQAMSMENSTGMHR